MIMSARRLFRSLTVVTLGLLLLPAQAFTAEPGTSPREEATSGGPRATPPATTAKALPSGKTAQRGDPRQARLEQVTVWHTQPETLRAPAFAIAENLYYVGNKQFSSHLLVGRKEIVLVDTPYPEHAQMLVESIRTTGVDPAKITLVLHTHAHDDHYGATKRIKDLSGAKTAMGAKEIRGPLQKPHVLEPVIARFCENHGWPYEPFEIDRLLNQGDTIDIGGTVIHCHHTPGHTKGTMSYTFDVTIDGERHTAVLWGGPGLQMFKPNQAGDWARSFEYLKTLKADVPLGAHPFINNTLGKHAKRQQGVKPDPFVDPEGWRKFLEKQEAEFKKKIPKSTP
jgi:metallo-beta-lactamase class B